MSIDVTKNPPRVIFDTNTIISALVFGGKPETVFRLVFDGKINSVISPILLSELTEVLRKRFNFPPQRIQSLEEVIKQSFEVVHPSEVIKSSRDEDDNRVLEAAVEGRCEYIITGDKDLLVLGKFRGIKITT